jgi:hypothetical protein
MNIIHSQRRLRVALRLISDAFIKISTFAAASLVQPCGCDIRSRCLSVSSRVARGLHIDQCIVSGRHHIMCMYLAISSPDMVLCICSYGELYVALAAMEADGEDAPVMLHESPAGITVHFTF